MQEDQKNTPTKRCKQVKSSIGATLVEYVLLVMLVLGIALPAIEYLGIYTWCNFVVVSSRIAGETAPLLDNWQDLCPLLFDHCNEYPHQCGLAPDPDS